MNIKDIILNSGRPELYEKSSAFMWNDEHISKQLLEVHLNPEVDLASRKESTIERTVDWLLKEQKEKIKILDLGCGPGLYTERIAKLGHDVTGVDISKVSIKYAIESAEKKGLDIEYINSNYLELNLPESSFDLVMMIYTDFGVLVPEDRKRLLELVHRVLKKGGTLIFDVLNDKEIDKKLTPNNWEATSKGFWRDSPYIALSNSYFYEIEKVILYQHLVVDDTDDLETYRFWTHFFTNDNLLEILEAYNFENIEFFNDVLPKSDLWNGDNVTFCKSVKG